MDLIEQLVAECDGDAVQAVLRIAGRYGIGFAYINRFYINRKIIDLGGDELTDDEWEQIHPQISATHYDDYITEFPDVEIEFIRQALMNSGVQRDI